ncbi:hypothetical protein ElyMa_005506500 [Elysia marginata]|uniref:Uncharacterized protein n=1 Tax=Elysia marginata TaxID=1093978 RepID=A0AAV4EVD1_9GAST|nr:hypothetical protein ElyMa_005506500 [Elysia marginata]
MPFYRCYQKHLRGLHRLLLQCDLFTPNRLAPSATPTTCSSNSTPPTATTAPTPTSPGVELSTSSSSVAPSFELSSNSNAERDSTFLPPAEAAPSEPQSGLTNPVFYDDPRERAFCLGDNSDYPCQQDSARAREVIQTFNDTLDGVPIQQNARSEPGACSTRSRSRQHFINQLDCDNQNSSEGDGFSSCSICHLKPQATNHQWVQAADQPRQHEEGSDHQPQNQYVDAIHEPSFLTHASLSRPSNSCRDSNCDRYKQNKKNLTTTVPPKTASCEEDNTSVVASPEAAASPVTTSGYSNQSVDSRKKTARVSWNLGPEEPTDLTQCHNNNTKTLPCVDLVSTAPTTTPPHSSPASPRSTATLQPAAQLPLTSNLNFSRNNNRNHSPRHNHTEDRNYYNTNRYQPLYEEDHNSAQIPPPGRDHHYPYHNHHHRQRDYPYHILPPQEAQPAATKTTPPPPPPPESPDGSGGRSSPPPPPPPPQVPAGSSRKTTSGLAAGPRRKPPAPLRPGVAAGPGVTRGGTTSGSVPSVNAAMSCPSGQACSMGGGGSNGGGGNGNGGTTGTEVQRRNLGFGGSGTSSANTGPGKRSLQHQNPEKHMEACARMPDEDITVLDENPVLIVPVQEPEPRPSTKISLPTVKSKVGVAGATKR